MAIGTALPHDWQPANGDREYGHTVLHMTDCQIDDMAEDMRLWALANANRQIARKADWSATFKGWMRRQRGRSNGKAQTANGGKVGFSGIAARIRYGRPADEAADRPPPEDLEPINRR